MIYPIEPRGQAAIQLPPGLRLAGMRVRIGAWLVDSLILGLFHAGFWIVALLVGAVGIDPEAQRQMEASPLTLPDVAPYRANLNLLAAMMAVFVVLNVAYATIFWVRFRGMPGQKLLSLQVRSAGTGMSLSFGRALIRAVVAVGIPMGSVAGLIFAILALETSVPWQAVLDPQPGGPGEVWLSTYALPVDLAILGAFAWPVILLISTVASPLHQGIHDRLADSLVVGKVAPSQSFYGYYAGYGAAYGPPDSLPPGSLPPGVVPPGAIPPGLAAPGSALGGVEGPAGDASAEAPSPSAEGQDRLPDAGWTNPYGLPPGQVPGPDKRSPWLSPLGQSGTRSGLHVATVNRRLAAYAVDCVLVYMVYVLTAAAVVATLLPSTTTTLDERTFILLGLVGGLEQMAYFAVGWRLRQGTIGQRLFRLTVTDVTTGKALGWMDVIVRWAVLQGPFALVTIVPEGARDLVILVAGGWILYLFYTTIVDPDQRGLHDRFLNSKVSQDV